MIKALLFVLFDISRNGKVMEISAHNVVVVAAVAIVALSGSSPPRNRIHIPFYYHQWLNEI